MKYFLLLTIIISASACNHPERNKILRNNNYSEGFSIRKYNDFSILEIFDPWQNSPDAKFTYNLDYGETEPHDTLSGYLRIKCPVEKVIVLSTTHIGYIAEFGEQESILAVSGKQYVYDSIVRKGIVQGRVGDIGYIPAINYERIIDLNPDLVILYGLESSVAGVADRLASADIPSLIIAEYLEPHPLGKMEWIKVFGALYGKEEFADSIFKSREKDYNIISQLVADSDSSPKIMVGLPWKDTWYMAGGKSFTAKLIKDAGGDYLWKNNNSEEFIALDLESAFSKAMEAGIWINTGSASGRDEIRAVDSRFELLPVFKSDFIYNNNARVNEQGGNDFWESGVMHPELILRDLIKIFHPSLMIGHEFVYYRKIE